MSSVKSLRSKSITRLDDRAAPVRADDAIAVEEPLELRVAGRSIAVLMRTPGHDRELAAGFLVTEGLIQQRDQVIDMIYCGDGHAEPAENVLDVVLAPGVAVDFGRLTRHVFTSSSCGICSKASIEAVRAQFRALTPRFVPRRAVFAALPDRLRTAQAGFAASGGVHASGLFDADGQLEIVREDVGRHNALDKLIGHAFFAERLPLDRSLLLVSGRVSFEIVQKALAAGLSCVAAISAPTSAAIELAEASGQTLIGFLRGGRMNIYAGEVQ